MVVETWGFGNMTRINVVDPEMLTDQHLMAEYRELPMVMGSLRRSLKSKNGWQPSKVPKEYTLNHGHVYFFTNKKTFLVKRFNALVYDLIHRGYCVNPTERRIDWGVFDEVPQIEWEPSDVDVKTNALRITERILQKPYWYRYKGTPLTQLPCAEFIMYPAAGWCHTSI